MVGPPLLWQQVLNALHQGQVIHVWWLVSTKRSSERCIVFHATHSKTIQLWHLYIHESFLQTHGSDFIWSLLVLARDGCG